MFNILISCAVTILGILQVSDYMKEDKPPEVKVYAPIKKEISFHKKTPKDGLMEALHYYNVKHPKIVYAQAVLETSHFKSKACLSKNNLFGLYDSKRKTYHSFNNWWESVEAYKKAVQKKYRPPNDYYKFLRELPYATDPQYINKLKRIVNDQRNSK